MALSGSDLLQFSGVKPNTTTGGVASNPSTGFSGAQLLKFAENKPTAVPIQPQINPQTQVNIGNTVLPKTTISQAPQIDLWGRLTDWFRNTFTPDTNQNRVATAQNAYAISKTPEGQKIMEQTGVTLGQLGSDTGGSIFRNSAMENITKELGIRNTPTNSEFTQLLMTAAMGAGVISAPTQTIKALAGFEAVNRVKSGIISAIKGEGFNLNGDKMLSDFTPEGGYTTKTALDVLDFLGTGALTGGLYKVTEAPLKSLTNAFTKNVVEKFRLPQTIEINPKVVKETVLKNDNQKIDSFIKKTEISQPEWATSVITDKPLAISTEKVANLTQESYWTDFKNTPAAFKVVEKPTKTAKINTNGKIESTTQAKVSKETQKNKGILNKTTQVVQDQTAQVSKSTNAEVKVTPKILKEAQQYKSANDFITAKLEKNSFTKLDQFLTEIPVKDVAHESLKSGLTAGRKIDKPIEAEFNVNNGTWRVIDGQHRIEQAIANGDKTINAKVTYVDTKYGQNQSIISEKDVTASQLTDIWNKANKTQTIKTPAEQILSTPQSEPTGTGKLKESRLYKRVKESLGTEYENKQVSYNVLDLEKQALAVAKTIQENPQEAMKIARGFSEAPIGTTQNAFSIGLAELARQKGDLEVASALWSKASLRSTRLGQEIVSLRGSMSSDTAQNMVKRVIDARLNQIADKYNSVLENLDIRPGTSRTKQAIEIIKDQATKAKTQITKKEAQIKSITDVLDAITCK